MVCHRAIQLCGWYWHKVLCIPVDCVNNIYFHQTTEVAIRKLERYPNRIEFIWSIHMIANYEIGQTPARFDNVIGDILKVVCGINIHKGKKIYLQHTIQHSSNILYYIHFWSSLELFHVTKSFLSKILSAQKMIIFQDSTDF